MISKKWIIKEYGYTPMMALPQASGKKMRDLSHKMIVTASGEIDNGFEQVYYGGDLGWVLSKYLENYDQVLPKDCVDMGDLQTPDENDAQQYIVWNGVKQVNMCGEMCVAFLLNLPLETVLENWRAGSLPFYKRIFGGGRATGTSAEDLMILLALYGKESVLLSKILPQYTPELLRPLTCITSCRMDTVTGRLNGGGVGHWVVPVTIHAERCGYGYVEIYNPYPNRIEVYSWPEYLASCRQPYGTNLL